MRTTVLLVTIALLTLVAAPAAKADQIPLGLWFWVQADPDGGLWDDSNCPAGNRATGDNCFVESENGLVRFRWVEDCGPDAQGCWFPVIGGTGQEFNRPGNLNNYPGYGDIYIGPFYDTPGVAPDPWLMYQHDPTCLDFYNCMPSTSTGLGGWGN